MDDSHKATNQTAAAPRWTIGPGRAVHDSGAYAFSIAANAPDVGMAPWELDDVARHIVELLNAERP